MRDDVNEWLKQFPSAWEEGLVKEDLVLDGREIELWERIIIAHVSCPNAGNSRAAVEYADNVVREHRKRVGKPEGGPYR